MRKYLAVTLSSALIACSIFLPKSVEAAENSEYNEKISEISVVNEVEYIQELQSLTDNELIEKGASKDEIKQLREFDIESLLGSKVEALQSKSEKELLSQGYSLKQIDSIQNYSGTNAQTRSLLANLTGTLLISNTSATSSLSYIKGNYSFNWSKAPLVLIKDFIGITWSEGFYLNTTSGYTKMNYHYYNIGSDKFNKTNSATIKHVLNKGLTTEFGMGYRDQEEVGIYTKKGNLYFHLEKKSKVAEMAVQSKYGHTTIAVGSPSVSIPAGLSITFSYQVKEEDSDYRYVDFSR